MNEMTTKLQSKKVDGCHYFQCGSVDGDHVFVFLHGMPTNAHIWRHVLPEIAEFGPCIAPDLLGMGQSKHHNFKEPGQFSVFNHIHFIEQFLDGLDVSEITLVMHGWGSVIGSEYARAHAKKIRGLVYLESHLRPPVNPEMLSLPMKELAYLLRTTADIEKLIIEDNHLIEQFLPKAMMGKVNDEVMALYQQPFSTLASRQVLLGYLYELPLGHQDSKVVELIRRYSEFLQESTIPKCLLYSLPGLMTTMDTVMWAKDHMPNLTLSDLGEGMHCAPETCPERVIDCIKAWLDEATFETNGTRS